MDIARPDLPQRKRTRRLVTMGAATATLMAMAIATAMLSPGGRPVDRTTVWIDDVIEGPMVRDLRGTGSLVPLTTRWVSAATGARVERVVALPGAEVEAGTVILELSNPDLDEALMEATSALAAGEADAAARAVVMENQLLDLQAALVATEAEREIAQMQADAEAQLSEEGIVSGLTARQSIVRAQQLARRSVIESERLAKFRANIETQGRADAARIDQLRAAEARRRADVAGLLVRAGMDGVLQQVVVEEGQQVAAGSTLARVARPDALMAQVRIPEFLAPDLVVGQAATVTFSGTSAQGRISRIDPAVVSGTVRVDIRFDAALPASARPDQTVDAMIVVERIERAVHLGRPAAARPGETLSLYRISPDGDEAERVDVQVGRVSADRVEIVGGLAPGDRVILSDTRAFEGADTLSLR